MNNLPNIIFIVGNSRTGTTMLSKILGQHSDIFAFNELHFIESLVSPEQILSDYIPSKEEAEKILTTLLRSQRERTASNSDLSKYISEATDILSKCGNNPTSMEIFSSFCSYETKKNGKQIACEQTPKNIYYVNEILKVLPNAKFINMYRDPRDIMLSQKRKWKRRFLGAKQVPLFRETFRTWLNYHPIIMAKLWNSAINKSLEFRNNDNFFNVKYEDLLNNSELQVQHICQFLNIYYQDAMLKVPQEGSSSGVDNTNKFGIDKSRQGNWDNGGLNNGEIGICQHICAKNMLKLGYKRKAINNIWFWWIIYGLSLFFKMAGALLFNLSRTKNLFTTIKRRLG